MRFDRRDGARWETEPFDDQLDPVERRLERCISDAPREAVTSEQFITRLFGRAHVAGRMDLRRRKSTPPTPTSFETAARGLRSLGFREPEARRALETLETKREMQAATVETILREALLVVT